MATILLIFVANRNFQLLGNIITDMQLFIMENKELFIVEYLPIHIDSVADPEWFILDPDPALNFTSSGSRQKFRIHADQAPTYNNLVYFEIIQKHPLNSIKKKNLNYLPFSIQYYCPIVQTVQNSVLFICSFTFCWIQIRNYNSGSRQKFRIHPDPDWQHCI